MVSRWRYEPNLSKHKKSESYVSTGLGHLQFLVWAPVEISSCVFMRGILKCLQAEMRHLHVRKGAGGEAGCLPGGTGLADGGRRPGAASRGCGP